MLEASVKPMNLYSNGMSDGYDSAVNSGESSRRNSVGFKEYVRNRRYTMMSRPNRVTVPIPQAAETTRKNSSSDSQFGDMPDDLEEELSPRPLYQRRMSVPEKVFLSADYAILRPSMDTDVKFEIVAAFDRHTDPYRHYMQNLTCYDLQPNHGAVVVIDGNLKIHKALTALSQCGHQAAVVSNLETRGGRGMLTITDCLRAIVMASEGVYKVADQTVAQFLKHNGRKSLIAADANTSVWDAARMICLNRVHRIPVVQYEDSAEGKNQGDLLYILSLRAVFVETVLKLSDSKRSMGPHIKQSTLSERKLGTWNDLYTIQDSALTSEAISLFLEKRISTVPIVDSHGKVKAVLSKIDVMSELVRHPANYLEVLEIPAMELASCSASGVPFATTTMTIFETIALLVTSERQSLVVVDVDRRPLGVVSYSDVMDYIQNYSEVFHKTSLS